MKILYIYSGERKKKFKGVINKDYPDTQFYGLNHLDKFNIKAEYKEFDNFSNKKFLNKFLSFRIKHLLMFFLTINYDIVFGSSVLYTVMLKKIFKTKTKFVLFNISLNRNINKNKNNFFVSNLIKICLKEIDIIVSLSNFQNIYLLKKFNFLKNKMYVVPLGADIKYYQPVYEKRNDYILSVGRDNGRDYKTIIEVAKRMPKEKFEIICSKRNLKEISNIPENVNIIYDLHFNKLKEKYQKAKILLLITKDNNFLDGSDCSGQTVLLDAMASGLPIIASKKEYLKEYGKDKNDFLLVNFYDFDDIIKKINFLKDLNKRNFIAKNARENVEKNFSTEKMANNLSIIFKKINY